MPPSHLVVAILMTEIVVKGDGESEKAVANVCFTRNGVSNDLSPNLEGNSRDDADGLIFAGCHGGELTSRSLTVVVVLSVELKQWKEQNREQECPLEGCQLEVAARRLMFFASSD